MTYDNTFVVAYQRYVYVSGLRTPKTLAFHLLLMTTHKVDVDFRLFCQTTINKVKALPQLQKTLHNRLHRLSGTTHDDYTELYMQNQ